MKFEQIKKGMVFEQHMPPRFLYIREKEENQISLIGIDYSVYPGDIEWDNDGQWQDKADWNDYFSEAEIVNTTKQKRQVFKELMK